MTWLERVVPPHTMTSREIRAELRRDLDTHDQAQHPVSQAALARRIRELTAELDRRARTPSD